MLDSIPPEITIASFSIVGILTGYVWNVQAKRISKVEDIQKNLPCNKIYYDLAKIKTDLKWIKQNLKK